MFFVCLLVSVSVFGLFYFIFLASKAQEPDERRLLLFFVLRISGAAFDSVG